ncbi:FAD-dependent oxidoreductase [Nocardia sp. 348MFTsu5.1]|uniref:FAD-dependent oxidoreductase n=1 Tax=Nocardia sp. 348MFTsu5.1 TaxID=1172185 RepID=UPI00039FCA57
MGEKPFRIALVGSGPSGIYTIEHLLEQRRIAVEIDVIERLPNPWGLARSGVAPDHPEKKLVIDRHFAHLLKDSRVRFFGNVEIGRDVGHAELVSWYDAVVYASGASGDVRLGLPGEDLPGCFSAREFVGYYNGHPDLRDLPLDLSTERAVVIGNGNVAIDVARILTLPLDELARTDISDVALDALRTSSVREVVVMGRRGHLQAAFKNPELEELERLPGVDVVVDARGLPTEDEIARESDSTARRKLRTLLRMSLRVPSTTDKRIVLRFSESPIRITGEGRVEEVEVVRNELQSDHHGRLRSFPTDEKHVLRAGLVFRAVGYRGVALPGLPFDEVRGVVPNDHGRVTDTSGNSLPRVYVTGWAKRGAQGIIGSNKKCSSETVGHLLADLTEEAVSPGAVPADTVLSHIEERADVVQKRGWMKIDHSERTNGRPQGRPRVKFTDRETMLRSATSEGVVK